MPIMRSYCFTCAGFPGSIAIDAAPSAILELLSSILYTCIDEAIFCAKFIIIISERNLYVHRDIIAVSSYEIARGLYKNLFPSFTSSNTLKEA